MWRTEIGVRVLNAAGASVKYARVLEQVDGGFKSPLFYSICL